MVSKRGIITRDPILNFENVDGSCRASLPDDADSKTIERRFSHVKLG